MLDPSDPLFATIGSSYIRHLRAAWGHDPKPYYAADVFNEMSPASDDPAYLSATSAAVYAAMSADEPAAVWVMQAWLFFSDQAFWREPQMRVRGVSAASRRRGERRADSACARFSSTLPYNQ